MPKDTCSIDGCVKASKTRGWCSMHYERWRRRGDPHDPGVIIYADPVTRFWAYVDRQPNGCWIWTGSIGPNGYGHFTVDGETLHVHRWAYEHFCSPVPDGLVIDHLCRVRHCVNYESHLEAVPQQTNLMRAPSSMAALNAAKTHCLRGHPFDASNTYISPKGSRQCRECKRLSKRRRRETGRVGA